MIVYNPQDGAPIFGFVFGSIQQDPHYPDGYELSTGEICNGLMQYDTPTGKAILETYEFLSEKTEEEAKKLLARPVEPKYKCDFPDCEFSSTAKIGLAGHKRTHQKELETKGEFVVPDSVIPISRGRKVISLAQRKKMLDNNEANLPNGTDQEGVEWYGEGVKIEGQRQDGFGATSPIGKGHFGG